MKIKYYYTEDGTIVGKSKGTLALVNDYNYITTDQDVDLTQYTINTETLELIHTPVEKTVNPRG